MEPDLKDPQSQLFGFPEAQAPGCNARLHCRPAQFGQVWAGQ
jgi:hypothetical protein